MTELGQAVETVINRCLGVKPGERVVVVVDAGTRALGDALRDAAAAWASSTAPRSSTWAAPSRSR